MFAVGNLDGSSSSNQEARLLQEKLATLSNALAAKEAASIKPPQKLEATPLEYANKATGSLANTLLNIPQNLQDMHVAEVPSGLLAMSQRGIDRTADLVGRDNFLGQALTKAAESYGQSAQLADEYITQPVAKAQEKAAALLDSINGTAAWEAMGKPGQNIATGLKGLGMLAEISSINPEKDYTVEQQRIQAAKDAAIADGYDPGMASSAVGLTRAIMEEPTTVLANELAQAAPSVIAAGVAPYTTATGLVAEGAVQTRANLLKNNPDATSLELAEAQALGATGGAVDFVGDRLVGAGLASKGIGKVLPAPAAAVADVPIVAAGEYAAEKYSNQLKDFGSQLTDLTPEQLYASEIAGMQGAAGGGAIRGTTAALELTGSGTEAGVNKIEEIQAARINTKALGSEDANIRINAFTRDPELNDLGTKFPETKYSALAPEDHEGFNPIEELHKLHTEWQGFIEDQITADSPKTLKEKLASYSEVRNGLDGAVNNLKDLNDVVQASDTATPKQKKELQRLLDFSIKDVQEKAKVAPEVVGKYMDDIVATMQGRAAKDSKVTEEDLTPETLELAQEAALYRVENPTANATEEENTKAVSDLRSVSVTKEDVPAVVATDTAIQQVVDTVDAGIAELETKLKTLGANPDSAKESIESLELKIKKLKEVSDEIQFGEEAPFLGLKSYYGRKAAIASATGNVSELEELKSRLDSWATAQQTKQDNVGRNTGLHTRSYVDAVRQTTLAINNMQKELDLRIKSARMKSSAPKTAAVATSAVSTPKTAPTTESVSKSSTAPVAAKPIKPVEVKPSKVEAEAPPIKVPASTPAVDTKEAPKDEFVKVADTNSKDYGFKINEATGEVKDPTKDFRDTPATKLQASVGFASDDASREANKATATKTLTNTSLAEEVDTTTTPSKSTKSIIQTSRVKDESGNPVVRSNVLAVFTSAQTFHHSVANRFPNISKGTSTAVHRVLSDGIKAIRDNIVNASAKKGSMSTYSKTASDFKGKRYVNQNTALNLLAVREKDATTKKMVDKLDSSVAVHTVVAALDYAKFMLKGTLDVTPSTVERAFGLNSLVGARPEDINRAMTLLTEAGVPVAAAAMDIGKSIIKMSGIKFAKTSLVEDQEAMATALGVTALNYLNELGLITFSTVPNHEVAQLKDALKNPDSKTVFTATKTTNQYFKYNKANEEAWDELMKALKDPSGIDILEAFRGEVLADSKALQTEAYTTVKADRAAGRTPDKKHKDAAQILNNNPYKFNPYLIGLLVEPSTRVAAAQQIMQSLAGLGNFKLYGLKDEEITKSVRDFVNNNIQAMKRAEQEVIVADHIRSIQRLIQLIEDTGEDVSKLNEDFFARHAIDVNDRIRLDSTINPGSDKLHRLFLVNSDLHNVVTGPATNNEYKDALATNLGLIDEKSDEKVVTNARKSVRQLMMNLSKMLPEDTLTELQKLLNKDPVVSTSVNVAKLYEQINAVKGMSGKVDDLSTLMDLANLTLRFPKNGTATKHKFTSTLTVEVDGKSNGVALALMQSPIGDLDFHEMMLRKVGIFIQGSYSSFSDWASKKKGKNGHNEYDVYETNAVGTSRALKRRLSNDPAGAAKLKAISNLLGDLLVGMDGTVQKIARELNKNPLMVFSYNAGETAIVRNVINDMIGLHIPDRLTSLAATAKKGNPEGFDAFKKSLKAALVKDIKNLDNLNNLAPETAIDFMFTPEQLKVLKDKLLTPIAESLTTAVADSMDSQRNAAKLTTAMFNEQYDIYKDAEAAIKKSMGISSTDSMTIEQAENLAKQLKPFIPSFKGPFALANSKPQDYKDDVLSVGSPVFTLETVGTANKATVNMVHKVNAYSKIVVGMQPSEESKLTVSRNISVEHKEIGNPGVAASALMTHAQDAAIMSLTIKKMKNAGITGLSVYDAVKTGSKYATQVSKLLNESTIEVMEMYNPLEDSMSSLIEKRYLLARLEVSLNTTDTNKVLGHYTPEELQEISAKMLKLRPVKGGSTPIDINAVYSSYEQIINANNTTLFQDEVVMDQYPTAGGKGAVKTKLTPRKLTSLVDMFHQYQIALDPDYEARLADEVNPEDTTLFGNPNANAATLTSLVSSDTVNSVEDIFTLATTVAANDNQTVSPHYLKEMQELLGKLYSKAATDLDPILVEVHDGSLNTGSADIMNRKIEVVRQASPVNNITQSNTEVLLHEFLHVVTTASALAGVKSKELLDLWTMAKDSLDYTVFLSNTSLVNTPQEIQEAKALYDYIFNNPNAINGTNVGLLEFISFGLSNPNMRDALKNIKDTTAIQTPSAILKLVKEGSFLDKIVTAVLDLIGKLLDRSVQGRKPTNVQDALVNLAQHLIEVEAQSKTIAGSDNFLNRIDNAVETVNKKVGDTFDKFSEKYDAWYAKQSSKTLPASTTSARLDPEQLKLAQWAYFNLAKSTMGYTDVEALRAASSILTYEDRTQALSTLAHATVLKETGLLKHLYHQIITDDPLSKPWVKALRATKAGIEMHRKALQETITGSVKDGFTKLTEEQDDFLERNVIRTDLQALHEHLKFDVNATIDMMRDPNKLASFILSTEARLQLSPAVISQAKGLADYMITGKTTQKNQLRNSTAIALHAKSEISVPDLDAYISALALQKASVDVTTLDSIEGLEAGLSNLLELHRGYVQDTKDTIFAGSELQMIKGYTREDIDSTKEYAFMRSADAKDLKVDGWKPVGLDVQDPITGTSLTMYVRSNVMKAQVHSGVFSLMSNKRKGTSYSSMLKDAGIIDPKEIEIRVRNLNPSSVFVPILNNSGEIIDYAINISEENRVNFLGKKYSASAVLGRMYGSKLNKQLTPDHNAHMISVAKRQWDAEKAVNADKFEWIDANHKEYGDLYKSLPTQTKKEIENTFGRPGIPVPKGSVPLALGFEKYLIGETSIVKFMQAKMPTVPVKYFSNLVTRTWQDFVSLTKNKIVIRMPQVVGANLVSNSIFLAIQGVPLKDIYTGYRQGALELKQFLDVRAEMLTLQAKIPSMTGTAKTSAERRIAMLNNVLDKSPIRHMVKEGFFQSITEDVGATNLTDPLIAIPKMAATFIGGKSAMASVGLDKLNKVPYAGAVVDHMMMNPNTSMFRLLNNTVKYSDFIGRYVLHKHTMAQNAKLPKDKQLSQADIMTFVAESFIQYDLPDPKSLDFANSIGFFMFTKYFVGIQKVIRKQVKDRSLSAALALTANYALLDLSVIQDSSMFVKDLGIMMHLNPLDIVETGTMPSGLELYMDLLRLMTPRE
jgi:hypothetical protein